MVVSHDGCSIVRPQCRRPSRDQRFISHCKRSPVVLAAGSNEREGGTECFCRCLVRPASATCRISGMGVRAKGRVEYVLRSAHTLFLCEVRSAARLKNIFRRRGIVRVRPYSEADAGDAAFRFSAAGFLAAEQVHGQGPFPGSTIDSGEDTGGDSGGDIQPDYFFRALGRRICKRSGYRSCYHSCCKRICRLLFVYSENALAGRAGRFISGSFDRTRRVVGSSFGSGWAVDCRTLGSQTVALCSGGMVLVFGNTRSGGGIDSGRKASHGGSVYVYTVDWPVSDHCFRRHGAAVPVSRSRISVSRCNEPDCCRGYMGDADASPVLEQPRT